MDRHYGSKTRRSTKAREITPTKFQGKLAEFKHVLRSTLYSGDGPANLLGLELLEDLGEGFDVATRLLHRATAIEVC